MTRIFTRGTYDMRNTSCRPFRRAALAGLIAMAFSSGAHAQEAFLGPWLISKAEPAPWAEKGASSDAQAKTLLGKQVSILQDRIDGPKPLGCSKLKYKVTPGTAQKLDCLLSARRHRDIVFPDTHLAIFVYQLCALGYLLCFSGRGQ